MGFLVDFQGVSIWEDLSTLVAVHRLLTCVRPLHMQPQIIFTATGDWAALTLIDGLVSSVNGPVCFQTVSLSESCMAYITLVRLLSCVDSEVAFQPKNVMTGVSAVVTLIRLLSAVPAHVSL